MKTKVVLESDEPVKYFRQDNGYTLVAHVVDANTPVFHVRLQSCEEEDKRHAPLHDTARLFAGKKVRVTVEAVE